MDKNESREDAQARLRAKYRTANSGTGLTPQQAWDEYHAEEMEAEDKK